MKNYFLTGWKPIALLLLGTLAFAQEPALTSGETLSRRLGHKRPTFSDRTTSTYPKTPMKDCRRSSSSMETEAMQKARCGTLRVRIR